MKKFLVSTGFLAVILSVSCASLRCKKPIEPKIVISNHGVATFNIQGWANHDHKAQAATVKKSGVGIVGIQEGWDRRAGEKLADALRSDWKYRGNIYIQRAEYLFESVEQEKISHNRYIDHALIKHVATGHRLGIINTHWDHRRGWQNDQNLKEARKFVASYIESNPNLPLVVMGDFNRYPDRDMFPDMERAVRGNVYGSVDAIYYRNMDLLDSKVMKAPSDHDFVAAYFQIEVTK